MRKRYVTIGTGGRALMMYLEPLASELVGQAEVVGLFDINPLRAEAAKKQAGLSCAVFGDVGRMLAETRPDVAIVTTIDSCHDRYVVQCLEAGIDVICEKPMTTDAEKCRNILEAEKRSGKTVTVTFNLRFQPYTTAIKELLAGGAIGEVLTVDLEWMLDTSHGADYFRRWHRRKANSGGLLVHKATHHFDMVNWWIEDEPAEVMAFGSRRFYGPTRKERGERCCTCAYARQCEFYFDISADKLNRTLYLECEAADGYHRDGCVFADEVDIEDSMSVNVRYARGALLSYSLVAHSPYEGYRASLCGTGGRMEISRCASGFGAATGQDSVLVFDRRGRKTEQVVPQIHTAHGGGDALLRQHLFVGGLPDPLGHQASSHAGAMSALIGIAANCSIARKQNIRLADLLPLEDFRPRT